MILLSNSNKNSASQKSVAFIYTRGTHKYVASPLTDGFKKRGVNVLELSFYTDKSNPLGKIFSSPVFQYILQYIKGFFFIIKSKSVLRNSNAGALIVLADGNKKMIDSKLVINARRKGIKTFFLQPGIVGDYYIPPKEGFYVDLILATGEFSRKKFLEAGVPEDKILVTGMPSIDKIQDVASMDSAELRKKFDLPEDKKIILWCTESNALDATENKLNAESIEFALKGLDNADIAIKLHPNENQEAPFYREKFKYIFGKENDTIELIKACDAMVMRSSVTGLYALMLHKPLIQMDMNPNSAIDASYHRSGVALLARNKGELKEHFKSVVEKEIDDEEMNKMDEYAEYHAFNMDGKATERCINAIFDSITH